jgi:c(7)-type cytochrome triheme protein
MAMVIACSRETLSIFFDGVPKPGEEKQVKKPQRRRSPEEVAQAPKPVAPDEKKPAETLHVSPTDERLPAERSLRWEEVEPLLSKDAQGTIDWGKALDEGIIKPRSSLDPKTPELEALPLEVELVPGGRPEFRVVFRHEVHTRLLACDACHPKLFAMQKGADLITMEKIYAGEFCGRCHGTVAFAVEPNCARCHQALAGGS